MGIITIESFQLLAISGHPEKKLTADSLRRTAFTHPSLLAGAAFFSSPIFVAKMGEVRRGSLYAEQAIPIYSSVFACSCTFLIAFSISRIACSSASSIFCVSHTASLAQARSLTGQRSMKSA